MHYNKSSVLLGETEYREVLKRPTGEYVYEVGTTPTTATVQIPAYKLSSTNYLNTATVRVGRSNAALLYLGITNITWGLQIKPIIRPIK